MKKYVIGIDYGTLSARAVLMNTVDGTVVADSEYVYPHAILDDEYFPGKTLKKTDAYQHPQDYLDALSVTVKGVLEEASVCPESVVGIGLDFTACTPLPVLEDGTPLCFMEEFRNEPQAYVKLWKHQSAQKEAAAITQAAEKTDAPWLQYYGGKISAEWFFPKLWELLRKAPHVFSACSQYLEAGDWLTWKLTGNAVRSGCMAGYKALWNEDSGFPPNAFWESLDPGLEGIIGTKVRENVKPAGSLAGRLNKEGSALTGLPEGIAVAVPIIDAHAAVPGSGVTKSGEMVLIAGTSSCQLLLGDTDAPVAGISGSVKNGVLPGHMAMEAGQAAVGDTFGWFVKNAVPESYEKLAREKNISVYALLTEKAQALQPGQSGLLALDWFNGNRVPYSDGDLTGVIVGLNLHTKPEEIFRALIEATAFGTKSVVDTFQNSGVRVDRVFATGGISKKNPFMMQLYADVLGKEIRIVSSSQATAKGSAILAAAAAGEYDSIAQAIETLADPSEQTYYPNMEHHETYQKIYAQYLRMCAFFAKDPVMKELK